MPRVVRKRDNSALVKKYLAEPKETVLGSKIYVPYLGTVLTFTYNGFPVSIRFDGTNQEFPKTIARMLRKKLDEIAISNAPVSRTNEKIN